MTTIDWTSTTVSVAGAELHVRRGGKGSPVLLLHRDIGTLDRLDFYDALAARHEVLIPDHPGFGNSPRPDWLMNVRDIAAVYRAMLDTLGRSNATLVGLGFGGWIAAEMATFAPVDTPALVLAGAMGIKPPSGDIMDQALVSYIEYVQAGFHDLANYTKAFGERPSSEQLVMWDICREMSFRVAWKPYMYNDTLPNLLTGVRTRPLVIWGDDDKVVPRSAGEVYARQLAGARQETIANAGHLIELEQQAALANTINNFLAA